MFIDPTPLVDINDGLIVIGRWLEGTNLNLLRQVEKTVDMMQAQEEVSRGGAKMAIALTAQISTLKLAPGQLIDPDDKITDGLSVELDTLEDLLPKLVVAAAAVHNDPNYEQSRDLLQVACERNVAALAEFIECGKELVSAVIAFNLRAEPRPTKTFASVDELISDMRTAHSK